MSLDKETFGWHYALVKLESGTWQVCEIYPPTALSGLMYCSADLCGDSEEEVLSELNIIRDHVLGYPRFEAQPDGSLKEIE